MATEIQQRNAAKKEWTGRLRGKGHTMTWRVRRGPRTWNGQCRHCTVAVTVYPGGGSETSNLGWIGRKRCPGRA